MRSPAVSNASITTPLSYPELAIPPTSRNLQGQRSGATGPRKSKASNVLMCAARIALSVASWFFFSELLRRPVGFAICLHLSVISRKYAPHSIAIAHNQEGTVKLEYHRMSGICH